jgi:TorA maturation chaperone TorD
LNSEDAKHTPISEAAKVNFTRASIYSLLSTAFKVELNDFFIETIMAMEPALRLLSESQGGKELKDGTELLLDSVGKLRGLKSEERKKALTDLAAEYAGLFLGLWSKPVYLVESVYLGKEHLLYEEPYHEIVEAYRSLGFAKDEGSPEPEDHLAVEFEFMATLCRWTSKTLEQNDIGNALTYINLQKEFLSDHIMRWVPEVCEKLVEATNSGYFLGLAHLTDGFINLDNEVPDHLTEILKGAVSARK